MSPSLEPTAQPTNYPTQEPTLFPTGIPSDSPTLFPTSFPTIIPLSHPTQHPSAVSKYPTVSHRKGKKRAYPIEHSEQLFKHFGEYNYNDDLPVQINIYN